MPDPADVQCAGETCREGECCVEMVGLVGSSFDKYADPDCTESCVEAYLEVALACPASVLEPAPPPPPSSSSGSRRRSSSGSPPPTCASECQEALDIVHDACHCLDGWRDAEASLEGKADAVGCEFGGHSDIGLLMLSLLMVSVVVVIAACGGGK
eukprot:COSAG03_NODE_3645_length_1900_cov_1.466408_1_plen_155_part_00